MRFRPDFPSRGRARKNAAGKTGVKKPHLPLSAMPDTATVFRRVVDRHDNIDELLAGFVGKPDADGSQPERKNMADRSGKQGTWYTRYCLRTATPCIAFPTFQNEPRPFVAVEARLNFGSVWGRQRRAGVLILGLHVPYVPLQYLARTHAVLYIYFNV